MTVDKKPNNRQAPKAGRKLTPRQKQLIMLLPAVESGKITMTQAMKRAGYADSTADQQTETLKNLRENSEMQKALRKHGFTEELIAEKIVEGLQATRPGLMGVEHDDHAARHKYLQTGAELLDAFPAKKNITAEVGIDALISAQESSTTKQ